MREVEIKPRGQEILQKGQCLMSQIEVPDCSAVVTGSQPRTIRRTTRFVSFLIGALPSTTKCPDLLSEETAHASEISPAPSQHQQISL